MREMSGATIGIVGAKWNVEGTSSGPAGHLPQRGRLLGRLGTTGDLIRPLRGHLPQRGRLKKVWRLVSAKRSESFRAAT